MPYRQIRSIEKIRVVVQHFRIPEASKSADGVGLNRMASKMMTLNCIFAEILPQHAPSGSGIVTLDILSHVGKRIMPDFKVYGLNE